MANSAKKRVLLMRHGETDLTPGRHFIGRTDLSLSATGRSQAASMGKVMLAHKPERCFCSPMLRCLETADAVIGASGLANERIPELREIDFGNWEKLTFNEIQAVDPEGVQRWLKFDRQFSFGNGERIGAFFARVKRVAVRIAESPENTILVVTHGGVIRALLCHFLELPLKHFFRFEIGPASVTEVDLFESGHGVLTGLMQCSYDGGHRHG
jgi:alpha-ribazole phosphatase